MLRKEVATKKLRKRHETDSPSETPEETNSANTLILVCSLQNCKKINKFLLFQVTKFVEICYSSHRELIQSRCWEEPLKANKYKDMVRNYKCRYVSIWHLVRDLKGRNLGEAISNTKNKGTEYIYVLKEQQGGKCGQASTTEGRQRDPFRIKCCQLKNFNFWNWKNFVLFLTLSFFLVAMNNQ